VAFLIVRNLTKRFGGVEAVNDATFDVARGEIFSVVGPSGSGKTTLLRCIGGIEVPDRGFIELDGVTLYDSSRGINVPPERRGMGYVPQTWALWPHMRVKDNIAFGLRMRGVAEREINERVLRIARALRIEDLLDRYPWQLSGGQQQRVAVARALVIEPKLVLFDEPLSNLDAALREEARIWLKDMLKSLNITALYVTHDIHEALFLSDRLAFMLNGRILFIGAPEEVYGKADIPELARIFGHNIVRAVVVEQRNSNAVVELEDGQRLECSNPGTYKGEVYIAFPPAKIAIGRGDIKIKILRKSPMGGYIEYIGLLAGSIVRIVTEKSIPENAIVSAEIVECRVMPRHH